MQNIVEQWGTGIQRVIQLCANAGLPAPDFDITGDAVRIVLRRLPLAAPRQKKERRRRPHKRDEALLAYLKKHPDAPLREAADAFFVNVSTISRFVQDLRKEGKL